MGLIYADLELVSVEDVVLHRKATFRDQKRKGSGFGR